MYIGRGTKWGNPFKIGKDGTRTEVINKYREWIMDNSSLIDSLDELDGKVLGCHCEPKSCHGDVLVDILRQQKRSKVMQTIFKGEYDE